MLLDEMLSAMTKFKEIFYRFIT